MVSKQCQFNCFIVVDNVYFEYLFYEILVYINVNVFSYIQVYLDKGVSYVGWDIVCLGLFYID